MCHYISILNTYTELTFYNLESWILDIEEALNLVFRSISMAWECGAVERRVGITIANQTVVSNHLI